MKKLLSLATALVLGGSLLYGGGHGAHWGYTGQTGPEHWGDLSKDFEMCKLGKNQSPVDLRTDTAYKTDKAPIIFSYTASTDNEVNNGHSIQVNIKHGSFIQIDGMKFNLKQFHFHTPSENTIDGRYFPMEAHFVHVDDAGNIAVVAVMFKYGKTNEALQRFWDKMPADEGAKRYINESAKVVTALLPKKRDYYRFNGSLTTPPCSEGVRWFVMKEPLEVSKEQVAQFEKVMGGPNNRPVQPFNARMLLK